MRSFFAFFTALTAGAFLFHCSDQEQPKGVTIPPDDIFDAGGDGFVAPPKSAQPHANMNPQPKVTECKSTIEPSGSAVCAVTKSAAPTANKVIRGTVLGANEVFHGGEVVFDANGLITCTGCDCSADPGYADATVISCPDGVISPGLINPHEHLTFQNNKPIVHADKYENRSDWQGARGHQRLDYSSKASQLVIGHGELRFIMSGGTAVTGSGGAPGLLRNLDGDADAAEGLPMAAGSSDTFPLGQPGMNLATGCAYTSVQGQYGALQHGAYIPHISEGIDPEAHNEFTCLSDETGKSNVIVATTAIIHAVALTPANAKQIRKGGAKVVWSPRSNVDLYGNTAQAVMLDLAGVTIALGTDWIPSGSMNEFRELQCADSWNSTYFDHHFTDADLWRMVTVNAAIAVGAGHAIGILKPSYLADIAVYDGKQNKDFRAIIDGAVEDVALVLRGGQALYGDTNVMSDAAIAPDASIARCSPWPGGVCGHDKTACIDQRASTKPDLQALLDAGAKYYPPFFCKGQTPTDEPSCHPARPKAVRGSTVYDGKPSDSDKDGDGVPDNVDNCPTIFNPVRPMDGGHQADVDNDGIGDACDECADNGDQKCDRTNLSGSDIDGDGVPNETDNCNVIANADQADADGDGEGDACDQCPTERNGAQECPSTITTLRNPDADNHPKMPSVIGVDGIVSARLANTTLYIQESATAAPWQGIYVKADGYAMADSTGPKVGAKVHVAGMHWNPYDQDQITASKVTVLSASPLTPPTPLAVDPNQVNTAAKAAAEPYESLLVSLAGPFTITNENVNGVKAANDDKHAFELIVTKGADDLHVKETLLARWGTPATGVMCGGAGVVCPYPTPGYTKGTTLQSLTGIMGYDFFERKLYPRMKEDIVH